MRHHIIAFGAGLVIAASACARTAEAAEIKALISTAVKAPFEELSQQFERSTGHKIVASYGPSGLLTKQIAGGESADFVVLGGDGLESLVKAGKIAPGGVGIARSLIGAGVAKGAPKPDISTPEKFKAVLTAAKSVAFTDAAGGGSSGIYLAKVFEKTGLAAMLKPKAKLAAGGANGYAGTFVANGEAEIALQPIPELMAVRGVDIVGPLPGEFQNETTYVGAVPTGAKQPEAARALIKALTDPSAASVYKAKGLTPG